MVKAMAAESVRRSSREGARFSEVPAAGSLPDGPESIATTAQGFDRLPVTAGIKLAAETTNDDFDHIAVRIGIFVVQMLIELHLGHHLTGMMGEVGQDLVFESGELQ